VLHTDSIKALLRALGWQGSDREVETLADETLRDHLLNFAVSDAEMWGQEFWSNQPADAMRQAADTDSADLLRTGDLQTLAHRR